MTELKIVADNFVEKNCLKDIRKYFADYIKDLEEKKAVKGTREFKVKIRTMNEEGKNVKHEVKSKMISDLGVFNSKEVGWDCFLEFRKSIKSIDNQIKKKVGEKKNKFSRPPRKIRKSSGVEVVY